MAARPADRPMGALSLGLCRLVDGSLFEDDDGAVWFVGHNHYYARMKADLSGMAGSLEKFSETEYSPESYLEGAYVFKSDGQYHLLQAAWSYKLPDRTFTYDETVAGRGAVRWSYDCIMADADRFPGPYGPRYTMGAGIGHDNFFQDKAGNWWVTMLGNPRGSPEFKQPFLCCPMIVPLQYVNGRFGIRH